MTRAIDPMNQSSIPQKHWPRLAPIALALGVAEWVLLIVSNGFYASNPTAASYQWQSVVEVWLNCASLAFLVGSIIVAQFALRPYQVDRRKIAVWAMICAIAAWPITYVVKIVVMVILLLQLPRPLF
jgi:uncharacterized membrane protein